MVKKMISSTGKDNLKTRWRRAYDLEESGELDMALELREELHHQFPHDKMVSLVLARSYSLAKHFGKAEKLLKNIVHEYPEWKLASLHLFHFYWDDNNVLGVDRKDYALEEMKRFQAVSHCEDYIEICREINEKYRGTTSCGKDE